MIVIMIIINVQNVDMNINIKIMGEYQFIVKVEGYKEFVVTSYGEDREDAKQKLEYDFYTRGLMNILYILDN